MQQTNGKSEWLEGLLAGLPICLGYLAVSFGVGILAVRAGMSVFQATVLSATNLTSAGQVAGIGIIGAGGSYFELALSQFVINLRYLLMGLSLSQKLDDSFHTPQRMIAAHGITDEIFGVASTRGKKVTPPYMYGMTLISVFGWVLGTFLGAFAGEVLPARVVAALGILLYGMFLAIIIPPAKKNRHVLFVIAVAAGIHLFLYYAVPALSDGFSVIVSGVAAAVLGAVFFPIDPPEEEDDPVPLSRPAFENEKEGPAL